MDDKTPKLSSKQRRILDYIRSEVKRRGYPPSVREIGDALGLSSSSTVHGHLRRLESKGFIRRDPTKPRAIEVLQGDETPTPPPVAKADWRTVPVPLLGRVTAGAPILAVENIEETYPLPFDLVRSEDAFMLSVRGESMADAGIHDGDLVIVRRQSTATNGEIVVAMIDDEATVKRFFRESDRIRLQPENPSFEPIYVRDVTILGKVVGLYRRLS